MQDTVLLVQAAEDLFGWAGELAEAQARLGNLTLEQFRERYAGDQGYLPQLTFDPAQAQFWADYTEAPPNTLKRGGFRNLPILNGTEIAQLKQNGFVITERCGAESFGQVYYQIYSTDLPVFITSDSVLHAWHRSFDGILTELESDGLTWMFHDVLTGMLAAVPQAQAEYGSGWAAESLADASCFLETGLALLTGDGFAPLGLANWVLPGFEPDWALVREFLSESDEFADEDRDPITGYPAVYVLKSKISGKELSFRLTEPEFSALELLQQGVTVGLYLSYHSYYREEQQEFFTPRFIIDLLQKLLKWGVLRLEEMPADVLLSPQRSGRVESILQAVRQQSLQDVELFGRKRPIDFSQFKPRGKYDETPNLQNYFRALMWLGYIPFHIAGQVEEASLRELGAAITLLDLLQKSGTYEVWQQVNRLLTGLLGPTDAMNFADLDFVLKVAGLTPAACLVNPDTLLHLQQEIEANLLCVQQIASGIFESPVGPEKKVLPRSFAFLGQRFTLDGWVLSQVVFDRVEWQGEKIQRRVPSCLDVAFAVLGNTAAAPFLADRIENQAGRKFRDGLPYQHQLAALRETIDGQESQPWKTSVYGAWLATLRELSRPTVSSVYPEAMRTRAWAIRNLNTQLGSWTQLKHDTILYAKQPYTIYIGCSFPHGLVEPVPHFWEQFEQMVQGLRDLLLNTEFSKPLIRLMESTYSEEKRGFLAYEKSDLKLRQTEFLGSFAATLSLLREMACKELAQQPLTEAETQFLKDSVEIHEGSGNAEYRGWYPKLFYQGEWQCAKRDFAIADVHTNPPDEHLQDPGCVLHNALGAVNLMVVAVENGSDRMLFAGPVYSHYEFETQGLQRKTKAEWTKDLERNRVPPRLEWMQGLIQQD